MATFVRPASPVPRVLLSDKMQVDRVINKKLRTKKEASKIKEVENLGQLGRRNWAGRLRWQQIPLVTFLLLMSIIFSALYREGKRNKTEARVEFLWYFWHHTVVENTVALVLLLLSLIILFKITANVARARTFHAELKRSGVSTWVFRRVQICYFFVTLMRHLRNGLVYVSAINKCKQKAEL